MVRRALAGGISVRQWSLWELPGRAQRYVIAVDALAVAGLAILVARASWRSRDVLTTIAFLACAALSIEVFRRIGGPHRRPNRAYNDLTAGFMFPVVVLLPPVYVAVMALPLHVLLQFRVTRLPPLKRVFNAAATIVFCVGAACAHDALALPVGHIWWPRAFATPQTVGALFVAAIVYLACNRLLVCGIIRRVAPATPWRTLLGDIESWAMSAGDVCAGVVMMLAWAASPILIVFALVPVILLQRAVLHTHLVEAARHDAKTGLANPTWWRQEAGRAVTRAQHGGALIAIVVVDLDRFKAINDRLGHLRGDAVLADAADTLRSGVRPGDLVGRFGGDEFTVLLSGTDEEQAGAVAERLRARLAAMTVDDHAWRLAASVGVAVFGRAGVDLDGLLAAADAAMYQSKELGGDRVCVAPGSSLRDAAATVPEEGRAPSPEALPVRGLEPG